jgi:acetyl esterase/lipase
VGGHDRSDPYLSPLFGDFTKGFPPTFITTGTRDRLLSNSVLMHRALRRADIPAELHVVDAMSHGGFKLYSTEVPEDNDLIVECRRFLNKYW